ALCSPNPNRQQLIQECNLTWNQIKYENKTSIDEKIHTYFNAIPSHTYSYYSQFTQHSTNNSDYIDTSSFVSNNIFLQPNDEELSKNAICQRDSIEKIKAANQKITEYKQMYNISTNKSFKETLISSIISEKQIVTEQTKRLKKLKCHTEVQARLTEKKAKLLEEALEEKYNVYLSRQCISTYLEPRHPNTFAARHHHYPAKSARTFAKVFADDAVIISQDDKAKVSLGIPAVGRTFKTLQSINESVLGANHDFPVGSKIKLIPSIYLIIDPANSNDSLRLGQLLIFIRPKYFVGTSSLTHMSDLQSIISNQQFAGALMKENKIKPIFVLFIDGGPDENLKHMKI
ncbi:34249_t:CDS:2, partial [Gigaspora margarita]